jgi:hypothetical protein
MQDVSDEVEIASFALMKAAPLLLERKSQPIPRVLIADDNADMRQYLENVAESAI